MENHERLITPSETLYEYSADQLEVSKLTLCTLRESVFEEFVTDQTMAIATFHNLIIKLTPQDLNTLLHVFQVQLQITQFSPIKVEIKDGSDSTENLIISLSNCEQFEVITRKITLRNESDSEVTFKILNSQNQSILARFIPWNGKISAKESVDVSCKIVMTGDTPSFLAIRVLNSEGLGTCLAVHADPKPLTKLPEIFHDVKIVKELGRGASGIVRLVKLDIQKEAGPGTERVLAVEKALIGMDGMDENQIEDFKHELMCLTSLEHENIVECYAYRRKPPSIYMEYIEDGDLVQMIEKEEFSSSQGYDMIKGIASAMAYLHELGYIHRDLKPANILVRISKSGKYCAKLCDFGGTTFAFNANEIRAAHGTSRFEAPEIIKQYNEKDSDFKYCQASDVYSFAMIMYCIIARTNMPMDYLSSYDVSAAVLAGQRPPLPHIPKGWQELLAACWHQQPSSRPTFPQIVTQLEKLPRIVF